jgi:hypothetical protein
MWLCNPIESLLGLQCSSFRHYEQEKEEKEELRITQKKEKEEEERNTVARISGEESKDHTLLEGFLLKLSLLSAAATHHLA